MEDRLAGQRTGRPGAALGALVAIVVITAAWWALALWPMGDAPPDWLTRTRAACFGSMRGGFPDAGGWILLVGEPLGMLGALLGVWGRSVKRDLRLVMTRPAWRLATVAGVTLCLAGIAMLGARVARASAIGPSPDTTRLIVPMRLELNAPAIALIDQRGRLTTLGDFRGQTVLLTFAFSHCLMVCPTLVHDLLAARQAARRLDVPLVVITLDPWRDTPERLPSIAASWHLSAFDHVLSGTVPEVVGALDALGVGRRRSEITGDIEHSGTVMILKEDGRILWRLEGDWRQLPQLLRRAR